MCNLYTYKIPAQEMLSQKQHFQLMGTSWTEWAERTRAQNEPIKDVFPNRRAPVVLLQNGQHVVREDMLWGFPPFKPGAGVGTNFRTLTASQWRNWLDSEHRCIVPAMAFSEPDKNTPRGAVEWRWFERADRLPFFFAGIWRPWTGERGTKKAPNVGDHMLFSIMTTKPNGVVQPVHEKAMPVMLMTADAIHQWLGGGSIEDAKEMQKLASDESVVMRPAEEKAA